MTNVTTEMSNTNLTYNVFMRRRCPSEIGTRVVIYLTYILIFNFMRGLLLKSFEVPGMGDTAVFFLMYQAMGVTFV